MSALPAPAVRQVPRRWRAPKVGTRAVQAAMLLPVVALLVLCFLWPLLEILLRSLNEEGRATYSLAALDLGHYVDVVREDAIRRVVAQTFLVGGLATVLTTALAFPTAYLLTRLSTRLAAALLLLILLPFWVSIVVRLFSLTAVLGRNGIVNSTLESLGLGGPHALLFNTTATVIGMVAYLLPYMILLLYAGLSGIDTSLLTAARTLGASRRQAFLGVYVPLARSSVVSSVLLVLVLALGFFLTPAILGGPKNVTAPIYIQSQIDNYDWGTASAVGILLLLVTVAGYVAAMRLGGNLVAAGSGGKGSIAAERLRLGPGSVLLWAITGLVLVFLLAPLLVIVRSSLDEGRLLVWPPEGFTTKWYAAAFDDPVWTDAIGKSLVVALATAAIATVAGLLLARRAQRLRSGRQRAVLEAAVFAPLVVPIILLSVGLFSVQTRLQLVGTDLGLILGHCVIAIPVAFAVLANALAKRDPAHEAAAWTLGASRMRAFWTVVIPPILPSLVGAFVIAFVTSWDEAVIALFLSGIEKTLPVTIFAALEQGGDPTLAAVSTMLIALVVVATAVGLAARAGWRWLRGPDPGAEPSA